MSMKSPVGYRGRVKIAKQVESLIFVHKKIVLTISLKVPVKMHKICDAFLGENSCQEFKKSIAFEHKSSLVY